MLTEHSPATAAIAAEIDLINNQGLGVPTIFQREISFSNSENAISVTTTESIEYLGSKPLTQQQGALVPWSLCQFDSGPGCEVVFPNTGQNSFWDMYDPSDARRTLQGDLWHSATDGTGSRYQIGMDKSVPWIEFRNAKSGLIVRRSITPLSAGLEHIDITDRDPSETPTDKGVCLSFYSDPSGFMEIEVAGGCNWPIKPHSKFSVTVHTDYSIK